MKAIKFNGTDGFIVKGKYENGNLALVMISEDEYGYQEDVAVITSNLGKLLPDNQAYVKTYSENTGIMEALVKSGIVEEILGESVNGYASFPLVKFNLDEVEDM